MKKYKVHNMKVTTYFSTVDELLERWGKVTWDEYGDINHLKVMEFNSQIKDYVLSDALTKNCKLVINKIRQHRKTYSKERIASLIKGGSYFIRSN